MNIPHVDVSQAFMSLYSAAKPSLQFMAWNTFLALVPLGLSLWIFRGRDASERRVSGWVGLAVFLAFLPNAPYVLTDVIHLVRSIRHGASLWATVLVLIPQYFLFMLIGIEAYTLSLINLGHYLHRQGLHRWVSAAEFALHGLCAVGIYLGRVPRFNSWDLITNPHRVVSFMAQEIWHMQALVLIAMGFGAIAIIYWPLKHLSLAMAIYWHSVNEHRSVADKSPT